MLPLISSFTAASSGPHGSLSNATPDMIWLMCIKELMSGNICRCGAYANIVAAIQQVRKAPSREQERSHAHL